MNTGILVPAVFDAVVSHCTASRKRSSGFVTCGTFAGRALSSSVTRFTVGRVDFLVATDRRASHKFRSSVKNNESNVSSVLCSVQTNVGQSLSLGPISRLASNGARVNAIGARRNVGIAFISVDNTVVDLFTSNKFSASSKTDRGSDRSSGVITSLTGDSTSINIVNATNGILRFSRKSVSNAVVDEDTPFERSVEQERDTGGVGTNTSLGSVTGLTVDGSGGSIGNAAVGVGVLAGESISGTGVEERTSSEGSAASQDNPSLVTTDGVSSRVETSATGDVTGVDERNTRLGVCSEAAESIRGAHVDQGAIYGSRALW